MIDVWTMTSFQIHIFVCDGVPSCIRDSFYIIDPVDPSEQSFS